jgi:subtilisin-like proprotein convertase family protein
VIESLGSDICIAVPITSTITSLNITETVFAIGSYSSAPLLSIPDNSGIAFNCTAPGILDTIVVSDVGTISFVQVELEITHAYDGDLDIFIEFDNGGSPICVELSTDNGSLGTNYTNTIFNDSATTAITSGSAPFNGLFSPEGLLADFNGVSMTGSWSLQVSDDSSGDVGTINEWNLVIGY